MNPNASPFQLQYPLDVSKKFRKKMIAALPAVILFALILGFGVFLLGLLVSASAEMHFGTTGFVTSLIIVYILSALVIWVLYALYYKAYIRRYYYSADEHFLTIKKGVFAPTEIHVQYQKIQDVYVDQDILDRMMGLYDVHIASATATSGIEAHIDGVTAQTAESLKNYLLNSIRGTVTQATSSPASVSQQASISATQSQPAIDQSKDYSSATFPIKNRWFVTRFVTFFGGHVLWLTYLVYIFLFSTGKTSKTTLLASLGYENVHFLWVFIGILVVMAIITPIYLSLWKKNYYFKFADNFILMRSGIISKQEQHVPYARVQDVIVRQGVIDRFLGLYNVVIQNAVAGNAAMNFTFGSSRSRQQQPTGIVIPGQDKEKANDLAEVIRGAVQARQGTSQTGL